MFIVSSYTLAVLLLCHNDLLGLLGKYPEIGGKELAL